MSLCNNINVVLPYSSQSSKWSLSKRFPNKYLYTFLISSYCPPQTCRLHRASSSDTVIIMQRPHNHWPCSVGACLVAALGMAPAAQTSHESKPSSVPQGYVEFHTLGHMGGSNRHGGLTVYPAKVEGMVLKAAWHWVVLAASQTIPFGNPAAPHHTQAFCLSVCVGLCRWWPYVFLLFHGKAP